MRVEHRAKSKEFISFVLFIWFIGFLWLNDLMARMIGAIFMKLGRAPATSIIFIVYSVIALMR
jgi:hypothetical protein